VKLPTNIDPSPLVEAVVDVRFEPSIPPAAVFGYVYDLIKDRYGNISALPVLQIPEEIREKDPNLFFQPHYRMASTSFVLQLGPRIFNLAALDKGYPGWSLFREEIQLIFDTLSNKGVIGKVIRVGMRYINFFEDNVFHVSNFSVALRHKSIVNEKTLLRVQFSDNALVTAVQITNDGNLQTAKGLQQGSVLDLDTFCLNPALTEKASEGFGNLIETTHQILKKRFFTGLKKEFVASLNPQYE
jgi:uncharacterized protein (TIGR04255 family)